jgi:hypothetical protein
MIDKEKIRQLAAQESPKLTRKQIADLVGCSPAFVTIILGPAKKYKPRKKAEELAGQEKEAIEA